LIRNLIPFLFPRRPAPPRAQEVSRGCVGCKSLPFAFLFATPRLRIKGLANQRQGLSGFSSLDLFSFRAPTDLLLSPAAVGFFAFLVGHEQGKPLRALVGVTGFFLLGPRFPSSLLRLSFVLNGGLVTALCLGGLFFRFAFFSFHDVPCPELIDVVQARIDVSLRGHFPPGLFLLFWLVAVFFRPLNF